MTPQNRMNLLQRAFDAVDPKPEPEPGCFRDVGETSKALIERGQWPWEGCSAEEDDLMCFGRLCKAWEYFEFYRAEISAGRFEAENELYPRAKNSDTI